MTRPSGTRRLVDPQLLPLLDAWPKITLTEEILAEPLNYSNFELQIPQGPGLGIVLDEDRVQYFRRDRTQISVGSAA